MCIRTTKCVSTINKKRIVRRLESIKTLMESISDMVDPESCSNIAIGNFNNGSFKLCDNMLISNMFSLTENNLSQMLHNNLIPIALSTIFDTDYTTSFIKYNICMPTLSNTNCFMCLPTERTLLAECQTLNLSNKENWTSENILGIVVNLELLIDILNKELNI